MEYTKFIKWENEGVIHTTYNFPIDRIIDIMRNDLNYFALIATWLEDENGKELAYFDENIQRIKGEEQLKKETKKEVFDKINNEVSVFQNDIKEVLDSLEEQGYIKFKEPKRV